MAGLGLVGTVLSTAGQFDGSALYLGLGVGGIERIADYPDITYRQSPGNEGQHKGTGAVKPTGVVDDENQRSVRGDTSSKGRQRSRLQRIRPGRSGPTRLRQVGLSSAMYRGTQSRSVRLGAAESGLRGSSPTRIRRRCRESRASQHRWQLLRWRPAKRRADARIANEHETITALRRPREERTENAHALRRARTECAVRPSPIRVVQPCEGPLR